MKIKDILETVKDRELPIVGESETIQEVLKKILEHPHTRLIFVVDKKNVYKGSISLEMLTRHLFPHGFEPSIQPRSLISMITSETAKDIMNTGFIYATKEDTIDTVINRMIRARMNEIAILDGEQRVISDLTMLDLLKYCHLQEKK
jgi:CBS domain-containing protein